MNGTAGRPVLKVCGARSTADVRLLATAGAGLVGLWHGVPGGPAELSLDTAAELAGATRATGRAEPVLVTFAADVAALARVLDRTGIRYVQLHAYQPPGLIRALRAAVPGTHVIKVLHVQGSRCLEGRLTAAYQRAGTDTFLLDTVTGDGRVGSTGQRLAPAAALELARTLDRPFLLAGGLRPVDAPAYAEVRALPGFAGVDVDTGARDSDGRFCAAAIGALAHSWDTDRIKEPAR